MYWRSASGGVTFNGCPVFGLDRFRCRACRRGSAEGDVAGAVAAATRSHAPAGSPSWASRRWIASAAFVAPPAVVCTGRDGSTRSSPQPLRRTRVPGVAAIVLSSTLSPAIVVEADAPDRKCTLVAVTSPSNKESERRSASPRQDAPSSHGAALTTTDEALASEPPAR